MGFLKAVLGSASTSPVLTKQHFKALIHVCLDPPEPPLLWSQTLRQSQDSRANPVLSPSHVQMALCNLKPNRLPSTSSRTVAEQNSPLLTHLLFHCIYLSNLQVFAALAYKLMVIERGQELPQTHTVLSCFALNLPSHPQEDPECCPASVLHFL